jgi:hypothetical protein
LVSDLRMLTHSFDRGSKGQYGADTTILF